MQKINITNIILCTWEGAPLSADALKLLALLLCAGGIMPVDILKKRAPELGIKGGKVDLLLGQMRDYVSFLGFRGNCEICKQSYLALVFTMLDRYPKVIQASMALPLRNELPRQSLWDLAVAIHEGKPITNFWFKKIFQYEDYIYPYFLCEEMLPITSQMDREQITDMLLRRFDVAVNLPYSPTFISEIDEMLSRLPVSLQHDFSIRELVDLWRYLYEGEFSPKVTMSTAFGNICLGIRNLYERNNEKAQFHFKTALKLNNLYSFGKNVFMSVVYNYYLMLSYKLADTDTARTKVNQLLKKDILVNDDSFPVYVIGNYVNTTGEVPLAYYFGRLSESYKNTISYGYWAYLIIHYFKLADVDESVEERFKSSFPPGIAMFRHELSPYLDLSAEEKKALCDKFGGEPLLASIRRKEFWQQTLETIEKEISESAMGTEERSTRIGYFLSGRYINLREQKRLKSGEWGVGKEISESRFCNGDVDCMDDNDRKIMGLCARKGLYYLTIDDIALYLVGTDKVYLGFRSPYLPVKIDEEKPFIVLEKRSNGYVVKSNVELKEMNITAPFQVKKMDETHYVVIPLSLKEQRFYQRLLKVGTFPLEAAEQLKAFLPKVASVVEVHSDLLEGGSSLDEIDGIATPILQVIPRKDALFDVTIRVCPLEGGKNRYVPGQGEVTVYDEKDGKRYQVKRKLRKEKGLYMPLLNMMEDVMDNGIEEGACIMHAEQLLETLMFITAHSGDYIVEWPEGGRINLVNVLNAKAWNISLRDRSGWFEVEGEVNVGENTMLTIEQMLSLLRDSHYSRFIRLNDTDYIAISESIRKQLSQLDAMGTSVRNKLKISHFQVGQLAKVIHGSELDIHTGRGYDSLMKRIEEAAKLEPQVPTTLQATLRDYQVEGFQWMVRLDAWGAGACLADDMGLGKTIQTIAFLLYKAEQGASLIVAPVSVIPNWQKELKRFAPTLNVYTLNEESDRKEAVQRVGAYDVMLTSYGLLTNEEEALVDKKWNIICLDEAHIIKNRETKTSAVAMKLVSGSRLILTGTPIQNYLGELWNLFQFINPGLLGSYDQFNTKFIVPIEQAHNKDCQQLIKRIVQPFMLRRTKAEVVEELPDKTEIMRPVKLSEAEMAAYEVMRSKAEEAVGKAGQVNINTLSEITRLRQAACDMVLVEKKWTEGSSKIAAFLELTEEIVEGGNRVLVFSQFTSFLALVEEALKKHPKLKYIMLDGSTPVKKREQYVSDFQKGKYPIFLISLKAGGLGLNLTGANYVIHLDPWWNPAIEQQATDRAYRIGQQQKVTVYHLIAEHTIEEKILRLHQTKRDLADSLLEGTNMSHRLTVKDLMEMLGK